MKAAENRKQIEQSHSFLCSVIDGYWGFYLLLQFYTEIKSTAVLFIAGYFRYDGENISTYKFITYNLKRIFFKLLIWRLPNFYPFKISKSFVTHDT